MIELKEDNLKEIVKNTDIVIVQYGASWCGNCRMIKPKFKRLSEQYEDVKFIYVDAEKFPNSRNLFNITNLPTFTIFKKNTIISYYEGNKLEKIKKLLEDLN